MKVLDHRKNYLKIDSVWAWITVDDNGNEGVLAAMTNDRIMRPLIAGDEECLQSMKEPAERIARETKKKVTLIRLHNREELETLYFPDPRMN